MALKVKQLIEKLETLENKNVDIFFETPRGFYSVDKAFLDKDNEIILSNVAESEHCECENCKKNETEL